MNTVKRALMSVAFDRRAALHGHVRRHSGRKHAGHGSDTLQQLVCKARLLPDRRVLRWRKWKLHGPETVRTEPEIDRLQPLERLHDETAGDEQGGGDGDLGDDQRRKRSAPLPPGACAVLGALHRGHEIGGAGRLECRSKAGESARRQRDRQREQKHPSVDAEIPQPQTKARGLNRAQGREQRDEPDREQHTDGAARRREQQVLREQLAHQAAASGAQGSADGNLALARYAARQKQARDVRAADEQQEPDSDGERIEKPLCPAVEVGKQLSSERNDAKRPATADLRMLLLEPAGKRLELRIGLLQRHAGLQAGDELVRRRGKLRHRQRVEAYLHRDPHLRGVRDIEAGRQRADHHMRNAVQLQGSPERARIAGEQALPEVVVDERDGWTSGAVVFGSEEPSHGGLHAESCQVRRRHRGRHQPLGLATAQQGELALRRKSRRGERASFVAIEAVFEHRRAERIEPLAQRVPEDESVRVRHRQRPQQERIERAEDRRVRADSERQRQHDDGREAGADAQGPPPITKVLQQDLHADTPHQGTIKLCARGPPPVDAGTVGTMRGFGIGNPGSGQPLRVAGRDVPELLGIQDAMHRRDAFAVRFAERGREEPP